MAQIFKINGTTIEYIQKADWENAPAGEALDGQTARQRWVKHIWQSNVMPVSEFDTIFSLEGETVTLITTNFNDRNGDYIQYFGVQFSKIVNQHVSVLMESIRCEFLVRL